MLSNRKAVRSFLIYADRPMFLDVVYKSKVTPRQRDILYAKFLDGHDNNFIASKLIVCPSTVRNELRKAYDFIYNYLLSTKLLPH